MTRALRDAHWSGTPSLSQLWLAALLRLVAMFVSNVAATVRTCLAEADTRRRMIASVLSGECHTDVDPADLPQPKRDPIKETNLAATNSETTQALILSSAANAARPSNDEDVLTGPSPLIPAKAGTQGRLQGLSRLRAAAPVQHKDRCDPWIPAFAGTSGAVIALERTNAP